MERSYAMRHVQVAAMKPLRSVATLDEIAAHPERAAALSVDAVEALLVKHATTGVVLLSRLLAARSCDSKAQRQADGDRLLGPADVAARIGKSRSWVEKHTDELPARRRVGGEGLWSEQELELWIRNRPRWGD